MGGERKAFELNVIPNRESVELLEEGVLRETKQD